MRSVTTVIAGTTTATSARTVVHLESGLNCALTGHPTHTCLMDD
jgi:hypothetical protein